MGRSAGLTVGFHISASQVFMGKISESQFLYENKWTIRNLRASQFVIRAETEQSYRKAQKLVLWVPFPIFFCIPISHEVCRVFIEQDEEKRSKSEKPSK